MSSGTIRKVHRKSNSFYTSEANKHNQIVTVPVSTNGSASNSFFEKLPNHDACQQIKSDHNQRGIEPEEKIMDKKISPSDRRQNVARNFDLNFKIPDSKYCRSTSFNSDILKSSFQHTTNS